MTHQNDFTASKNLLLKIGNPNCGEATSTSLLVPFAYCLNAKSRNQSITQPQWIDYPLEDENKYVTQTDSRARRKYFTGDTARVLFGRSRRFRLSSDPASRAFTINGREIAVRFHSPELLLFEFEASRAGNHQGRNESEDPLLVGILRVEFHLCAEQAEGVEPTLADLLLLNERLRYLREPFSKHERDGLDLGADYLEPWLQWLDAPLEYGGVRYRLMPETWLDAAREANRDGAYRRSWHATADTACTDRNPLVHEDDRGFVWSTAVIEQNPFSELQMKQEHGYRNFKPWLSFVNVDTPDADEPTLFEQGWISDRSYNRWFHCGSLYGFSTHSGVHLTAPYKDAPTFEHMRTVYLDQTMLLLYLRAVVFRFSSELVAFSAQWRDDGEKRHERLKQTETLLRRLAEFVNLYQFPLLSNQQQGLEIYALQRRHLDIDELFKEVQREAASTHSFLDVERTRRQADFAHKVETLGVPAVVAGLAAAVMAVEPQAIWQHTFAVETGAPTWWVVGSYLAPVAAGLLTLVLMWTWRRIR